MDRSHSKPTLIVIPTFNERDTIERLVDRLLGLGSSWHVLIVDDASPDGTGDLADSMAGRASRVHVLHRPAKMGMGTAYVAGFDWARQRGFGQVAQMDADLSHDPATLEQLIAALQGADLVIGSRVVPGGSVAGWGAHRIALSRLASLYCRLFLGWSLGDPTSGFRALGARSLEILARQPVRAEGFAFQIEVAYRVARAGLKIVEHPICFRERAAGRSKLTFEILAEAIVSVPLLRLCSLVGRV